ncbi:TMEM175 family protein [Streptomyces sp. NPDC000880]
MRAGQRAGRGLQRSGHCHRPHIDARRDVGLVPEEAGGEGLGAARLHEWPGFFAYVISFLIVGQIWLTHHNMWRYVERVDQTLLALNLALLLFVAPFPWTASLLAELAAEMGISRATTSQASCCLRRDHRCKGCCLDAGSTPRIPG